jgi:SAM-dependent methyltransferase
MNTDLILYYKQRATEYEAIYAKPERQADLAEAACLLKTIFDGKHVFEIACGTGYWTERIAETAASILATDINPEVLDIAQLKHYPPGKVDFAIVDFYKIENRLPYQCVFGGFIWSHIELQQLDKFLNHVAKCIEPGGTMVFMDNKYVEGSSLPIDETDEYGNTYQHRVLSDGSRHRVLKNFPTESFIKELLADRAEDIEFIDLSHYWIVKLRTRA